MTPVRLEPAAPRSRVKHSTTEPLRSYVHVQMSWVVLLFSIMGRGPGAFQIGKSGVNYLIGNFVIVNDYRKKTN